MKKILILLLLMIPVYSYSFESARYDTKDPYYIEVEIWGGNELYIYFENHKKIGANHMCKEGYIYMICNNREKLIKSRDYLIKFIVDNQCNFNKFMSKINETNINFKYYYNCVAVINDEKLEETIGE